MALAERDKKHVKPKLSYGKVKGKTRNIRKRGEKTVCFCISKTFCD